MQSPRLIGSKSNFNELCGDFAGRDAPTIIMCAARLFGIAIGRASDRRRAALMARLLTWGRFMTAEDRPFRSETVRDMQVAVDLAWRSLSPEEQAQSSKTLLAARILNAAEAGERSPARLLMLALMSARPLSSRYSKTAGSL